MLAVTPCSLTTPTPATMTVLLKLPLPQIVESLWTLPDSVPQDHEVLLCPAKAVPVLRYASARSDWPTLLPNLETASLNVNDVALTNSGLELPADLVG